VRNAGLSALLADGINLGLTRMADAIPGMSFERLAWVFMWIEIIFLLGEYNVNICECLSLKSTNRCIIFEE
jgi:hypothetical protein